MKIPFNKPYVSGQEIKYLQQVLDSGKISGDGSFTKKCQSFFQDKYNFKKVLLTTSCTDALEMASILCDIKPGDEVIAPSYTFVSTVNAFVLRGARIIFVDSEESTPNIDANKIEELVGPKTRVVLPVHYAGMACDMDRIMTIAKTHGLFVVEDAAQAVDSFYKGRALGSIGDFGTFSFHETKNIISGEGGMLAINDDRFISRAEIIREKGTNRSAFFRGEVDKYGWVDIGSSFLPSEMISAFLYAQLENIDHIQKKRIELWNTYNELLQPLFKKGVIDLPHIPTGATNNAHMFYIVCRNLDERTRLISKLRDNDILAVFHYLSLHSSPYYSKFHDGRKMPNSDHYTDCLLRLPLYFELEKQDVSRIVEVITKFFN